MVFALALAAAAATSPPVAPRAPSRASVQARATIRVISGARVRLGDREGPDGIVARDTIVRSGGGEQPAKLIEFQ